MTELKPCPFCGSAALINSVDGHTHIFATQIPDYAGGDFAECTNCSAATSSISDWNTRTTDTELTRLKRQVEVLSRGLRGLRETTTDNISEVRAENALAAADRIAKGEV